MFCIICNNFFAHLKLLKNRDWHLSIHFYPGPTSKSVSLFGPATYYDGERVIETNKRKIYIENIDRKYI